MAFVAHLEYIFHITCENCKFYWTYASMTKSYDIEKSVYHCPNCGEKNKVVLHDEVQNLFPA